MLPLHKWRAAPAKRPLSVKRRAAWRSGPPIVGVVGRSLGSKVSLPLSSSAGQRGFLSATAVVVSGNSDVLALGVRCAELQSPRKAGLVTSFLAVHRIDPDDGNLAFAVGLLCPLVTGLQRLCLALPLSWPATNASC